MLSKEIKKIHFRNGLITIIGCVIFTILLSTGTFDYIDSRFNDAVYTRSDSINKNIFVIGIDSYTISEQGAWPFDRKVIADTINCLNSDPENTPAAIGIDIVFEGYTNPESDQALVNAASYGNVVTSCVGNFDGNFLLSDEYNAYLDFSIANFVIYPFKELKEQSIVGHTNAMYDTDGVLRRHMLYFDSSDGMRVESMSYQLYSLYCERNDIPKSFMPKEIKQNFWRFHFDGKPGDYFSYSMQEILDGDYDPDLFKDAIVLIGPYDVGFSDDFITSADLGRDMYGVEYLANVTSSMLRNDSYNELNDYIQFAFLLFIFILSAYLTNDSSILKTTTVYIVLDLICLLFSYLLYLNGYVVHTIWAIIGLLIMYGTNIISKYIYLKKEKNKVTNIFGRYVDPKILNELLKEDIQSLGLKGKSTDIAVLFVDIRSFTTLSEQIKPEEVVEILDDYLTLTSECIKRNEGTVDKFIGDCTMAFWGAPLECEDCVYKACKAALEMVEQGDILSKKIKERFGKDVSFGVGINYGRAVVGNIGSKDHMDYTAIGDTVNTASRLESKAPKGTIYVSQSVIDKLDNRCIATPLEEKIKLKGKAEPLTVYILNGLK